MHKVIDMTLLPAPKHMFGGFTDILLRGWADFCSQLRRWADFCSQLKEHLHDLKSHH